MKKVHGIKVDKITKKAPGNGLPKWVREAATTRGYADALEPTGLIVNQRDINAACNAKAKGNGAMCVMAQAGRRMGAESVYFYRTTAWVDFGTGPIVRFQASKSVYNNVIKPFDKGDNDAIAPGYYPLTPPCDSNSLKRRRQYAKTSKTKSGRGSGKKEVVAHTDRVVMAAQA